jgi:hypothetical protein
MYASPAAAQVARSDAAPTTERVVSRASVAGLAPAEAYPVVTLSIDGFGHRFVRTAAVPELVENSGFVARFVRVTLLRCLRVLVLAFGVPVHAAWKTF